MTEILANLTSCTIGIDLGDRRSHYVILDEAGKLCKRASVVSSRAAFVRCFAKMGPCRVAIEVGTHSAWAEEALEESGHEVFVANPRRLRAIYQSTNKSDELDPETLARVARLDPRLLYPICHRHGRTRADLALVRSRDRAVDTRTKLINHVRGLVKSFGSRIDRCSAFTFHKRAAQQIPAELEPAIGPILHVINHLNATIASYDKQIAKIAEESYPETSLLAQIAGVGPVTSLSFVLTIEDPKRFPKARIVPAFLGLCPRRYQSGRSDPQLGITKSGDPYLRRLLVQSSQYILGPKGPDTDLRRWGLQIAARGGKTAKKRAVIAVARKLAVLLYRLWVSRAVYEPLRHSASNQPQRRTA